MSRARDAQHTQLQKDVAARDTQLKTCQAHNAELYRVGHEILDAYEHVGLGTLFSSRQPFAQSARVNDDIAQRYGDALYAGKRPGGAAGCGNAGASIGVGCRGERAVSARPEAGIEPIDLLNTGKTDMQDKQPNAGDARAARRAPIEAISADHLADVLRRAGYRDGGRAERRGAADERKPASASRCASATRPPLAPQGADARRAVHIDYTLSCAAGAGRIAGRARRGLEPDQALRASGEPRTVSGAGDGRGRRGRRVRALPALDDRAVGSPDPGIPAAPAQPSRDGRAGSGGTRGGRRPGRRLAGGPTTVAVEATAK